MRVREAAQNERFFWTLSKKAESLRFSFNFVGVLPHTVAQGWLTVAKTSIHHSGNYSCVASYSRPAWLLVHIVAGDSFQLFRGFNQHFDLMEKLCRLLVFEGLMLSIFLKKKI